MCQRTSWWICIPWDKGWSKQTLLTWTLSHGYQKPVHGDGLCLQVYLKMAQKMLSSHFPYTNKQWSHISSTDWSRLFLRAIDGLTAAWLLYSSCQRETSRSWIYLTQMLSSAVALTFQALTVWQIALSGHRVSTIATTWDTRREPTSTHSVAFKEAPKHIQFFIFPHFTARGIGSEIRWSYANLCKAQAVRNVLITDIHTVKHICVRVIKHFLTGQLSLSVAGVLRGLVAAEIAAPMHPCCLSPLQIWLRCHH